MAHFSFKHWTNEYCVCVSMALLADRVRKSAWKIVVYISSSYHCSNLMTMGKVYGTNNPSAISPKTQHPLPSHQERALWRVRVMSSRGCKHRGNWGSRQRPADKWETMKSKKYGQEEPNQMTWLNWQVLAIDTQGLTELGEKVLVRSPWSRDPWQVAKPVLRWDVGAAHCLGALTVLWPPLAVHQLCNSTQNT